MVAIKAQQAASFTKSPDPRLAAILLFGTDPGLVAERAQLIARAVAERETPPGEIIRIDEADLDGDSDRLIVELQTMPMFGGRKVVRTTAGRRINAQLLKPLVESGTLAATLVVEAGNLKPDDALRAAFEKSPHAAAVACYADEARDLEAVVREVLTAARMTITTDARDLLVSRLGADRSLSRNEIEKLVLYAQGRAVIEVEDVEAIVGDASELAIDKVVTAAIGGRANLALSEFDRAVNSGESPQLVIGSLLRYLHRLHRVRAAIDSGRSLDDIVRTLRPPLHFKAKAVFESHCRQWPLPRLLRAIHLAGTAAKAARLGGNLESALAEHLVIEVAKLGKV